tara:strand:- start:40 stop:255 length:216 start_codon:yes stop_codon:yes gene_type:complete
MKTITKATETKVISDNIQVKIEEDSERIYIEVCENQEDSLYPNRTDKTELVITNTLSIPKARELSLKLEQD